MADATADDFFVWERVKKSAEIDFGEGVGTKTIYFYQPQTVSERDAYSRHVIRYYDGGASISLEGMVDGIIARVKKADSTPMFYAHHKPKLLEMPNERLVEIWNALGAGEYERPAPIAEAAAKK